MSRRVAEWLGGAWSDEARARTGPRTYPRWPGAGDQARDATGRALADAIRRLWRDLWTLAYAPCPRCGYRRPFAEGRP